MKKKNKKFSLFCIQLKLYQKVSLKAELYPHPWNNLCIEPLASQCDCIEGYVFRNQLQLNKLIWVRYCSYSTEDPGGRLPLLGRMRALTRTWPHWHPDLRLCNIQNCEEKENSCCLSGPIYPQHTGNYRGQSDQVNKNHVSVGLGAGRRGL